MTKQRLLKSSTALRLVLAFVLVLGSVAFVAAPARAADGLIIRSVDTTAFPRVELSVLRPTGSNPSEAVQVTDGGKQVENLRTQSFEAAGKKIGTVIVLDTSEAMNEQSAFDKAKAAAKSLVQAAGPNEEFAVVTTNGGARPVVTLTGAGDTVIQGIDRLNAGGDSAIVRGIKIAQEMLVERADLQPNIVVIAGGPDGLTTAGTSQSIRTDIRNSSAVLFAVGIAQSRGVDSGVLSDLAVASGGRYVETGDPAKVSEAVGGFGTDLRSQSVVTFDAVSDGSVSLEVSVGGAVAEARVASGTLAEGANVVPAASGTDSLFNLVGGTTGLVIVGLITFLGVALLIYALAELVGRERNKLDSALAAYSDKPEEKKDVSKLADSEIIKKAIASTARMAEERGILERIQRKLEQADLALKPAEALFFTAVLAAFAMVVGLVFGGILGLFGAGLVFGFLPFAVLNFKAKSRSKRFTSQLPDTLQLLSGSLRAGYSLVQGIDAVAKQTSAPMSVELQRALSEARLGRPVEDALQEISDRVQSDDFEWTVMAVKIQREVGGNLAELLMTVANTMIERERLRREVRALTAEGRISAVILSALPPVIGGVIYMVNSAYMDPMINNFIGQVALAGAGLMIIAGYFVMNKMMEIEA